MKSSPRLAREAALLLYAAILYLYPRRYRVEFGDEMRSVFYLALQEVEDEVAKLSFLRGGLTGMVFVLRELACLPYAAFREHLRQRRLRGLNPTSATTPAWQAALAALVPFLVMGILPNLLGYLPVQLPQWLQVALAILLIEILLGTLLLGLVKRLPDWSLPYWGFIAAILSLLFFNATIEWIYRPGSGLLNPGAPWLVRALFNQGYLWFGLLLIAGLVALLSAALPPLRPFHLRLRADWTRLSFGLYGACLMAALFTFEEYRFDEPFKIAAALILSACAWAYLFSSSIRRRVAFLIAGLLLTALFTTIARVWLYPLQAWSVGHSFNLQTEMIQSFALWGWLLLVVLSPVLLKLLPVRTPGQGVS